MPINAADSCECKPNVSAVEFGEQLNLSTVPVELVENVHSELMKSTRQYMLLLMSYLSLYLSSLLTSVRLPIWKKNIDVYFYIFKIYFKYAAVQAKTHSKH